MVHGYTGNRRGLFFPVLFSSLLKQGYAVLSIDLNGHGGSGGTFRKFTYTRCVEDVAAAVAFLQKQPGINPDAIGAIGHSMGGTAILLAAARGTALRSLVLLAPVGDLQSHEKKLYTPSYLRHWKSRGFVIVDRPHLPEPLQLGYDYWLDRRRIDTLAEARNVHVPVLVVHGTMDRMVPIAESQALIRQFDGTHAFVKIANARHGFLNAAYVRTIDRHMTDWFAQSIGLGTVLVLDSAHRGELRIGLAQGKRFTTLVKKFDTPGSGHLLNCVDELLTANGLTVRQVRGVVIASGPGPFSALRAAASIANAFSAALRIPAVGIRGDLRLRELHTRGARLLTRVEPGTIVLPFYGARPNITKPKRRR